MREIATADKEQGKLWESLGIHSEEYKATDLEVRNLASEWKAEIWT